MTEHRSSLDATAVRTGTALTATGAAAAVGDRSAHAGSASGAVRGADGIVADASPGRRRSDRIILASATTQQAVDQASAVARSTTPVLIVGEPGTGRRHLARAIHAWSQRASGPLVHFSALGSAVGLQSRELFGSTAEADPLGGAGDGVLATAANGTLILERADLLASAVRGRLIEALKRGQYTRDGSGEARPLVARLVATAEPQARGLFSDLPVQTIELAPLARRREDVLPLAAHFLAEFAEEAGHAAVGFTVDARRWLVEEVWTGNVLELRERIRQAVLLTGSGSISAEALMLSAEGEEVPSFKEAKRAFETRYVESLLRRCGGNISQAARLAKKDRKDFYDVIRRTGVDPTRFRA